MTNTATGKPVITAPSATPVDDFLFILENQTDVMMIKAIAGFLIQMLKFRKGNLAMALKPFHIILIFLFAAFYKDLLAQTQNPRFNFKHLTVQTGLAQNIVYHFLQDSRGYMWLGTRNGLTLYDGSRTTNFLHTEKDEGSISGNFITSILEDSLHQVWIGTDVGISRYNRKDNSFSNFSVLTENGKGGKTFCVPLGFVNQHELWLIETKTKSIKIFDSRTQLTRLLTSTPAIDGVLRHDGFSNTTHIWTYLSTGTIHYIFKTGTLLKKEIFFDSENKKENEPAFEVVHVLPQTDSVVWLSTTEGLIELNPHNRKYILHKNWENQTVKELRYAAIAPNGLLWVATGNNGAYTFNLKNKKFVDNFRSYRLDPFSIGSNNIVSLYFDRVGNIWCGSYGQGISYTNTENNYFQKNLSRNELEKWNGNNNVQWIGYDNAGILWCIMNDNAGLWKLNRDKNIIEYREPKLENGKKFSGRFYKLLFYGDRYAWCIGKDGLFQYDLLTNRLRKMAYTFFSADLFGSNWVQDIIGLNDQSFLFSTFSGLYRMIPKNGNYDIQPFSELNKKSFISFAALHQDEAGTIYIKDGGDHFYVLQQSKESANYRIVHSIPFLPQVYQFYKDANYLLLATNFGLYQLNRNDYSLKKMNFKTTPPFLSISGLMKTDNKLWLFGEKGLFCFNEKKNTSRTFTVEDGLPANEFNLSTIIFSSGQCIAGTSNGLVSFFPNKLQDKIHPPLAQLTGIYINDVLKGFVPNPQETNKISLSHRQNTFSFDFAPIAFQNAAECSFEYTLEGYDQNWIRSGNTRYTRYSKIPQGNYKFQLRVIDANGMISPYNKTLEIEIAKAFWQTTLFKAAILAIILLSGWLVLKQYLYRKIRKHKLEFEKQQAVEKERTRIATDMHDDLGAGLSRIKFLSETIGIKKQQQQPIEEDITKIREYSHDMIDKMGEIVWALNEKNDSLSDLLSYTRAYAVEYLSQNGINCKINMPDNIPDLFVSGEFRRNIYLSVKEALHNIVKHAQADTVNIDITTGRQLHISIKDDGVGFDKNNIRPFSNGLSNMQNRMAEIKGDFKIITNPGTTIILTAPLS